MNDFENKSLEELVEIKKELENIILKKEKKRKTELLKEFKEMAKIEGLTLEEIISSSNISAKKKKLPPMYKNHFGDTWSGRGRKPKWIQKELDNGKKLEDFLII